MGSYRIPYDATISGSCWVSVKPCSETPNKSHVKTLFLQPFYMNVTNTTFGQIYKKHNLLYNHFNFLTRTVQNFLGPFPPQWMGFRHSSCTYLSSLCRCSPGHTWHSLGGNKDSSLKRSEGGKISFGSIFPSHPCPDSY